MTRTPRIPAQPRPSLFQAGASLRFAAAAGLAVLLWTAVLWASR
ncbi:MULTISPECIES: hypothetical protein [Methylobacterium]|uniref:Uncharacterized protein n=1 Tax=Methylobacterium goesingense TaxID=243690 RepID=A0ABV2KYG4_9HYPH|nr:MULTISPECIES: hypothetical protein [unclassified Methylobacterium]